MSNTTKENNAFLHFIMLASLVLLFYLLFFMNRNKHKILWMYRIHLIEYIHQNMQNEGLETKAAFQGYFHLRRA